MPGEASFLASHLGISVAEFKERYLDRIDTPYGYADVIRLNSACKFLDAENRCTVVDVKPVLCDCYPLTIAPSRGKPRFAVDRQGCFFARRPEYRSSLEQFVRRGISALKRLPLPLPWRTIVVLYDEFDFDYERMARELKRSPTYETVLIEDLLAFAYKGHERKARGRGLRLLAIRIRQTLEHEIATIRSCGTTGGTAACREAAAALRRTARGMLRRIGASRKDSVLLSEPGGRRYRRLVLETGATINRMKREARNAARRLKRAP